jgi:hypothetical protein
MRMTSLRTTCTRRALRARRALQRWLGSLAATRGQGTVEYVGIVIVIGVLLVALKAGIGDQGDAIGKKISKAVSGAIESVAQGKG